MTPAAYRAGTVEILLVLGLPTVLFLTASLFSVARSAGHVVFNDTRLLGTLAGEAIASLLLVTSLRRRGWSPGAIAGAPEPRDVFRGVLVWLGSYAAYYLVFVFLIALVPSWRVSLQSHPFGGSPSIPVCIAVALLNPLFEEFLWLGYAISALGPRIGLPAACFASAALRVAVHAYQGRLALVGIAAMASVFTWYYARTGRLWPVIVAHILADAAGLTFLAVSKP